MGYVIQHKPCQGVRVTCVFFLCDRIRTHLGERGITANLKYIDPSYIIRSTPANAWDRVLSDRMARHAVHAGMAGRTDLMIGMRHNTLVHVPIPTVVGERRQMDLRDDLWTGVLATTGQPRWSTASRG